jgi:hypothetical protein
LYDVCSRWKVRSRKWASTGRLSIFMHVTMKRNEVFAHLVHRGVNSTCLRNGVATGAAQASSPFLISQPIHQALPRDTTTTGGGKKSTKHGWLFEPWLTSLVPLVVHDWTCKPRTEVLSSGMTRGGKMRRILFPISWVRERLQLVVDPARVDWSHLASCCWSNREI